MPVEKNKVVSIDYTLTNPQGQVIDTSKGREPLSYLHGVGQIVPGLENALEGKNEGDAVQAVIPPEQAYGNRNDRLVQEVPRQAFAGVPDVQPGMQFQAQTPAGTRVVTVVGVGNDTVKVDANHPLAGQTLHFDVNVVGVRDATPDELTHGHAHGPGGVQHGHA
jgi:FKBP-type peptidyl-prolyl cis-trans isomerase SlyD